MSALVEVRELSKSYGGVRAVENVSFDVEPGQAVCLLGPNGSGKTTILRCIAGLLRPDSGTVRVCGADLRRDYRKARQQFSYLPQQASFPASVTVGERGKDGGGAFRRDAPTTLTRGGGNTSGQADASR
jgi:ABC-type multidrug transport system ATPase subunit